MTKFHQFQFCVWRTVLVAVCLSVCLSSCKDKDDSSVNGVPHDPLKPVTVTSFLPREGGVLTRMLLDGDNFGTDPSKIKVYFNHSPAIVVSSNGSRIYALAPRLPGDTCTVSVVVGNDSVSYNDDFFYHSVARVATITGNGEKMFQAGLLAEAKVHARYLSVDKENNIFASIRDEWYFGFARINESENIVDALIMDDHHLTQTWGATLNPNGSFVDPETQIVYVAADNATAFYVTFDPREAWAMRTHKFQMHPSVISLIGDARANGLAFCNYDSCLYIRYTTGPLIKVHPDTQESELVCETPSGTGHYGLAFHPLEKYLLYFSFTDNVLGHRHGISVLDVRNPESGLKKLNTSEVAGHRDGPIAQALFNTPWQICFDAQGNLFVAERGNHCIRMVSTDNMVSTVLGQPGVAGREDGGKETALFNTPSGIGVGGDGSIYVSDFGNARIRKLVIE
jgi:DNA-binding beta-propeller fold protein YncE